MNYRNILFASMIIAVISFKVFINEKNTNAEKTAHEKELVLDQIIASVE